jgi:hypothetical protein
MRVEGYAGYLERAILGERDEAMRHPAFQLPKIILPRTRVNKARRRAGAPRLGTPTSIWHPLIGGGVL